ncbi:hypothetical protein JOF53_002164 [Crossiella equi]|uniref:Beta-galactosidase n=1 Tax=Crossiella equi TaxID=130796 RepID=A0ABS5AAH4_9PSEU|nr:AbfB domain-containing protein [Crossiella equi]MBP2473292.1 hypothetical protein [Crossiella equi]
MSLSSLRRRLVPGLAALTALLLPAPPALASAPLDQPVPTPRVAPVDLTTPWTGQVSPANALPEYPRPQLVRPDWLNLNGLWEFTGAPNLSAPPIGRPLAERVLVPYPVESALSRVKRHEDHMFYRRTVSVPAGWSGRNVLLNFGAVTWETRVWVNGTQVGTHTGGFDAFTFDVTSALRAGENEIVVGVSSTVDRDRYPVGKQHKQPHSIWYTPASGIWQTVWLEPVRTGHITRLDTTPDVPGGALDLTVQATGASGQQVRAEVLSGGQVVGTATGAPGARLRVPVPNARLWSPDDPFLHDLRVTLSGGDAVTGYFGMRSLGKAVVGGVMRPLLNGKFVYQLGTLDQGYWPDGIYTAPTDEALRWDLERQKALGFNMVRKHIKVEPARWFYHADRLGLLVWQDMPSLNHTVNTTAEGRANHESELRRMIEQHKGITSIVQWVPFNEGWGEYDNGRIADLVRSLDPTRLVNHNSGSNCCISKPDPGNGDVIDDHHYQITDSPRRPDARRIAVIGEYGGVGVAVPGHEYQPGAGFGAGPMQPNGPALTTRYLELTKEIQRFVHTFGVSASVYTQPVDVENEVNGFYTYDRRVLKVDQARVRDLHRRVLATAQGTELPRDGLVSLGVTNPGLTDRSLRHRDSVARTDPIGNSSGDLDRLDGTFRVRPGLADAACVSLEARNVPGQYLRHDSWQLRLAPSDGSAGFAAAATYCARAGLAGGGTSLESFNERGAYLRHFRDQVYLARGGGPNPWDTPAAFEQDSTWSPRTPWWRSGADLPLNQARSLRVTTPGFTDRYLRHQDNLARTDAVTGASPALLKADATWVVRRGKSDSSCYSLESRNFPGRFLRHQNFRLRLATDDGTALFAKDATFCAQPSGADVRLASVNELGANVRHYAAEVWAAVSGGGHPYDTPSFYQEDTRWAVAPAWG